MLENAPNGPDLAAPRHPRSVHYPSWRRIVEVADRKDLLVERRFSFSYDVFGAIVSFFGLGPASSWIVVRPREVHVHMGWAFDVRIPRSLIVRAEPAEIPGGFGSMIVGWGVHTTFNGTWYVNGSQHNLVRVDLATPVRGRSLFVPVSVRTLYVSPDDPYAFLRSIS